MPSCHTCGVEIAPPVRQSQTIYVKRLFVVGGHHYCRHHVIAAAVAAGYVNEIKADGQRDRQTSHA